MKLTKKQQQAINISFDYSAEEVKENLTEYQYNNLLALANYLLDKKKKPAKFNMAVYSEKGCDGGYDMTDCGSVGCAIGHGPFAGIPKRTGESWSHYAERVFHGDIMEDAYYYLFSGRWGTVDNTALGAAKRILFLFKFGLPEDKESVAYKSFTVKQLR